MALEQDAIRGTSTWYGVQDLSQADVMEAMQKGMIKEKTIIVTGQDFGSLSFTLPKGASIIDSFVEVTEAFDLTAANTLAVGVSGSETTNAIADVALADAEAVGSYTGVPAGTLAANTPLAADATITCATAVDDTTVGKAYIHFRYRLDNR